MLIFNRCPLSDLRAYTEAVGWNGVSDVWEERRILFRLAREKEPLFVVDKRDPIWDTLSFSKSTPYFPDSRLGSALSTALSILAGRADCFFWKSFRILIISATGT